MIGFYRIKLLSQVLTVTFLLGFLFPLQGQEVYEGYLDGRLFVKVEDDVPLKGESGEYSPDDVDPEALAFLKDQVGELGVSKVGRPFHGLQGEAPALKRTYRVHFEEVEEVDAFIRDLEEHPAVEYAEKVPRHEFFYSPNDPYFTGNNQWYLPQISAENAWDISFGDPNITVAITDNAIDTSHEDLNGALWQNPGEVPNDGNDNDNNGYTDDYRGYDVGENDPDPSPANSSTMHGTHVAGLAGAETDNSTGIASIGFGVSIMAVKIADANGNLTAGYDGITYAADNGADVINMSWGGGQSSSTGQNAVTYAYNQGAVLVAAAGNSSTNTQFYPAAYNEVISVGATDQNDEKASFSNYGSWIDISAPGTQMASSVPWDDYDYTQGTSMASPVVAGLCGLMLSHNPSLSQNEVENCLKSTADPVQGTYSSDMGAGRINAEQAMQCVDAMTSSAAYDAGITQIHQPSGSFCDSIFDPEVELKNYGDSTLNSVDINYRIDNGTLKTESWTGSLTTNQTANVTLPTEDTTTGTYTFTAYTTNPNGNNDTVNSNDTASTNFTIDNGTSVTLELQTDCYGEDIGWEIRNPSNGQVIDNVSDGTYPGNSNNPETGGTLVTETYCLADGCYEFEITDTYQDGLSGAQYSGCSTNGDYRIIDNETGDTLVKMGPDPDYGSDTTHSFCVPSSPGPPTADFTANQTTIPVGGTVDFTDLSTGNPAPNSWNWTFNGGNPNNSTTQHPNGIQYNTAGLYDVSLTVDNGQGTDTETKTDYIEVVPSNGNCDSIDQIQQNDTAVYYSLDGTGCNWGFYPGHNGCGVTEYADSMYASSPVYVNAALVPIAKAVPGDPLSTFEVKVWDDNAGEPGNVVGSETVQISDMTEGVYNKVHFSTPPQVNGKFYIGYEIGYANDDTVAFFTAVDRGIGGKATSFYGDGTTWNAVSSDFNINTSMYTVALVATGQPSADFNLSPSNICVGDSVNVDGSPSVNVNDWAWLAPNGSPDTSYGQTSTIGFDTEGNHDVTLYAYGACTVDSITRQVSVSQPDIDSFAVVDASDCDTNDGELEILASSGFAPFQYSIDSGNTFQGNNVFTGLTGGVYDVVVKDDEGCTVHDTVHVDPTNGVQIDQVNVTDEQTCGGNDGEIVVDAISGTTPYEYSIDGGGSFQTNNTFTGLAPDTYDVQVRDDNGCIDAQTVVVDSLNGPNIDAVNVTDVQTCGGSDGEIEIVASGGTTPYEYSIDNGSNFQTNNTFTGLGGGSYDIVVEDDNGCTASDVVTVDPKEEPVIDNISVVDVSACGAGDGELDVTASGGVTPYEFSIDSGSSYQSGSQFTNLSSGIYDVVVKGDNGCTAHDTATINAPGQATIDSVDITDVTCNGGSDGEIVIHATNGNEYSIDDGLNYQTSNSFTGLSSNNYDLKVKSSGGCEDSTQVQVDEPSPVVVDSVSTVGAYCGDTTGEMTIHASGGSGPYQYSIDNGITFQTSDTFTGLTAGSYDIVVEDDSGCTVTSTDSVPGSGALSVSVATVDDTCNSNSGEATANVTGGSAPFTYDWSTGGSGQTETGLGQGTYSVIVTDPNGCADTADFSIYNNGNVNASATPTQTTICEGDTVTLDASGGTSYVWEDQSGNVISNGSTVAVSPTSSTEYYVTVTDGSSGCSEVDTSVVDVNAIPNTQVTPTDTAICEGDSVTLTASGGQSYTWNTAATTQSITVAPSTTTTYSVVASNGNCQDTSDAKADVTVDQNAVADAEPGDTTVALSNGANVPFDNGNSTGSQFHWDFGDGNSATTTDTVYSYGQTGTFTVILTAELGSCVDTDTFEVTVVDDADAIAELNDGEATVDLYPNPTRGSFALEVELSDRNDLRIEVMNSLGKSIRSQRIENVRVHRERYDLSDEAEGIYYVRIRDADGVAVKKVSIVR